MQNARVLTQPHTLWHRAPYDQSKTASPIQFYMTEHTSKLWDFERKKGKLLLYATPAPPYNEDPPAPVQ